jgi:hypothetical protein
MEQYITDGNEDAVTMIRRTDGLNGTVTITALGNDECGIHRWELTGDPISPGGVYRNRPDEYAVAIRFAHWALDQPQHGSLAQVDPDAVRLPKVKVESRKADGPAKGGDDGSLPLDEQGMPPPPEWVSLEDLMRIIRGHGQAENVRKWREANPALARQRNREAVAAHRARKKADERLRELSHATAFLRTDAYKAARAAQSAEIDRRVREKYRHLHEDGPAKTS